jgi:hypothetical protein
MQLTNRHDEAGSRFSKFCERASKERLVYRPGLSVDPPVFLLPNIRKQIVLSDFQEICYFSSLHTALKRFVKKAVTVVLYSGTGTNLRL